MALFRRKSAPSSPPATPQPVVPAGGGVPGSRPKKDRPTPSRRQAEVARRQRVTRTLNKKEARAESGRRARERRLHVMQTREAAPEKALMRDFVDSRINIGEFLLPSLVVILAVSFLGVRFPIVTTLTTLAMYLYILTVIADSFLMWRRFKKVLAARLPDAPTRGLAMYGMNRGIQIRRFRMPPPRVRRGEAF